MEQQNYCRDHIKVSSDMAVAISTLNDIKDKICSHIKEGEERGGYRDRLVKLEQKHELIQSDIASLKQAEWMRVIVAGVLGGLVSRGPEIIPVIEKVVLKFLGMI